MHRFHIVDVFADRRYGGNQLAVIEDAASLETDEMQRIAREFDFSETTFIESSDPEARRHEVRIFTPEAEIPFAGHPTLGTAFVLLERFASDQAAGVTLQLEVGEVPVRVEGDDQGRTLWMEQPAPSFRQRFSPAAVAPVLGLEPAAIHETWPIQSVSTGLPTVIVPLESGEALREISVDRRAYDEFVAGHDAKNILTFSPESRRAEHDLAVRVFAPFYGVPEDPATGSSNGCLAAYLVEHRCLGSEGVDIRVGQGYEMGRPSTLQLRGDRGRDDIEIQVGGRVIPVAEGRLVAAP